MFAKVKQFLGIGGVAVALNVPASVEKDGNEVSGTVKLTAKSDQHVTRITIKMVEEYTTGRGDEQKTKEYELGCVSFDQAFDMKSGEVKEIPFTLPYQRQLSSAQSLAEKSGAMGMLGKMGTLANNEKSAYFIKADADVEGTFLDPTDKKDIRLV